MAQDYYTHFLKEKCEYNYSMMENRAVTAELQTIEKHGHLKGKTLMDRALCFSGFKIRAQIGKA